MTELITTPPNPALVQRLTESLTSRGLSGEAALWATKALYPPANAHRVPMPALSTSDTLPVDYRQVTTLTAPSANRWDCMILVPPNDAQPVYAIRADAGANFSVTTPPAGGNFNNASMDILGARTQQTVYWRTVAANTPAVQGSTYWPATLPRASRHTYKSLTVHMTASDLYNGGSVVAGQVPVVPSIPSTGWAVDVTGFQQPAAGSVVWVPTTYEIPSDEQTLTRACPGFMSGAAKDGVFMVMKLCNLQGDTFSSGVDLRGRSADFAGSTWAHNWFDVAVDASQGSACWSRGAVRPVYLAVDSTGINDPWWQLGRDINGSPQFGTTTRADTSFGVMIFRGLDPNASLQMTLNMGLECTMWPHSSFSTLVSEPAAHAPGALDAYVAIAREMKDAYPASYNSLALLAPVLLNALRAAAPTIARVLPRVVSAAATALPVVKQVVDTFRAPTSERDDTKVEVIERPRARSRLRERSRSRARSVSSKRVVVQPKRRTRRR